MSLVEIWLNRPLRAASGRLGYRQPVQIALMAADQNSGNVEWLRWSKLARSTLDLLNVLDTIKRQGAGVKSLADTWADTTTPHGKLMLTVFGGLAEFERTLISDRTSEECRHLARWCPAPWVAA